MTRMWITMKMFIVLAVTLSVARADSTQQSVTESTSKAEPKNANTIPVVPQKPLAYYTQVPHRNPYVTYLQKPYYVPAPQAPHATMLIIAQPALLPQHMIYSQAAQQLLQYFQSNPQARYQFLQGTFQPQQFQNQQVAQSYAQPQFYQPPYQAQAQYYQQPQIVSSPQHLAFAQSAFQTLPSNYIPQSQIQSQAPTASPASGFGSPLKSAAPIITGFENFTPEQQAQIKEQLSSHFGTSLTHLSGNSLQVPTQFAGKLSGQGETTQQSVENKENQNQQTNSNYYRNQFAKQ